MSLIALSQLLIHGRADNHPIALHQGRVIDFAQWKADVVDAASRFKDYQRAALICQDSYYFIVGLFALLHAKTTIVFPPNNQPNTLDALKNEYDVVVDDEVIKDNQGQQATLNVLDQHKQALHFFTSGTTGAPKKISKNLAMLEAEILTLDALWGQNVGAGPVFATVSHQHIYGLTFKLLWPLMAGRFFAAEMYNIWENLAAALTPGSTLITSPAHLNRLDGLDPLIPTLRPKNVFTAGALLPFTSSQKSMEILGCRPTEIFGSTETGAFATRLQIKGDEPWQLFPGIDTRIDDKHQLILRTPFSGDDWIETSDRIEPLDHGFRFLGRTDRIAKIEGKRISLALVEQSLTHLPLVKTAAVVVLPRTSDCLGAIVVPSEEGRITLEALGRFRFSRLLRTHLTSTLESAGIPHFWRFVKELPTHELGKHRDADMRALFREEA